jgi:hypothetical protein
MENLTRLTHSALLPTPASSRTASPAIWRDAQRWLVAAPTFILALSPALILPACFLCLPAPWPAPALGAAAIAATLSGGTTHRLTLAFHGLIYLFAAAFASGLFSYSARALAGLFPPSPEVTVWIIALATILCYAIGGQIEETYWQPQLFHTLSCTLAVGSTATILVSSMVSLAAPATPAPSQVAIIRTAAACGLALALAWLGPRWQRVELVWLACATLAAVAARLLLAAFHLGHRQFAPASIFLFALTLILVPRIVRRSTAKWSRTPYCS